MLIRYRAEDFRPIAHVGGTTPGWPIGYDELEPWYQAAEGLYAGARRRVAGPDRAAALRAPIPSRRCRTSRSIADGPGAAQAGRDARRAPLPLGVDIDRWLARAATPWDAFPDTTGAKIDAESVGVAKALAHPNVTLVTGALVTRLDAGPRRTRDATSNTSGPAERTRLAAPLVVLSAGAVNSAVLLLRSADEANPRGLANRSDQVGRNFMNHNSSAVLAVHPLRRNGAVYQKTLQLQRLLSDRTVPTEPPLGNVQLLGKISGRILASAARCRARRRGWLAGRAVDFYAMSEDLPDPREPGHRRGRAHRARLAALELGGARGAGREAQGGPAPRRLPGRAARAFDRRTPSHQCGTARMGTDPKTSVVDTFCRAHDHPNLFVVDASLPADLGGGEPGADHRRPGAADRRPHRPAGSRGMKPVALVTGGQQGIGLGIAETLAAAGFAVALAAEIAPDAPPVADGARAARRRARATSGTTFGTSRRVSDLFDRVEAELGPVTTLVSNAGVPANVRGDMLDLAPGQLRLRARRQPARRLLPGAGGGAADAGAAARALPLDRLRHLGQRGDRPRSSAPSTASPRQARR